ncbi:heavy-metal-associated domain-containing protein [Jiella pacifica]|uniref:HMA domain-containing protein n=1 Tax=Jiella pacifica TaxID=2696469 RepID=A0A6N9T885_9HYPH|nr:heavy metal-associated domain-containing protein [Jiella pacifica]NDW07647.1 hypothetical protein [Jiella pacifica]
MDAQLTATTLTIEGMDCAGCGRKIERALRDIDGVRDVSLHYPDTTLGILHGAAISPDAIHERVVARDYGVRGPT